MSVVSHILFFLLSYKEAHFLNHFHSTTIFFYIMPSIKQPFAHIAVECVWFVDFVSQFSYINIFLFNWMDIQHMAISPVIKLEAQHAMTIPISCSFSSAS